MNASSRYWRWKPSRLIRGCNQTVGKLIVINEFNNGVCASFYWQVNEEIAGGKQFEYLYENALKEQYYTNDIKILMKEHNIELPNTLYETYHGIFSHFDKFRLIYLVDMIECFFKDFLLIKLGEDQKRLAEQECSGIWQSRNVRRRYVNSTSYMNVKYVVFFLEEKFGLDLSCFKENNKLFLEAGVLRNCFVHNNSLIHDPDMRSALIETVNDFCYTNENEKITMPSKKIWIYIESFRSLIKICDSIG